MALLVQKYGGTSVANLERIQRVADHHRLPIERKAEA